MSGFIAQFATADGIADVSPGRNIQIIPYGTFTGARFLDADTAAYERENEGRAGVDVKLVPRDAVTLDFTINPDFSQVESDEPQVTVNQRFEVFFPEKRPFFLENSDFFNSPLTLFFSRRVRDPQFGARMTGKYGKWATGALVIDDRAPGREADPASAEFEDRAVNVVGSAAPRLRQPVQRRIHGDLADLRRIRQPGRGRLDAPAHRPELVPRRAGGGQPRHRPRRRAARRRRQLRWTEPQRPLVQLFFYYTGVSPDFRVPLGIRAAHRHPRRRLFWNYRWHPKSGPLTDWGPNSFVDGVWNYAGDLQDWNVRFPVQFNFKKRTNVFYRHALISETVGGLEFEQREDLVQVSTSTLRWLSVDASLSVGTRPNYFPAGDLAPFLGDYLDWRSASRSSRCRGCRSPRRCCGAGSMAAPARRPPAPTSSRTASCGRGPTISSRASGRCAPSSTTTRSRRTARSSISSPAGMSAPTSC